MRGRVAEWDRRFSCSKDRLNLRSIGWTPPDVAEAHDATRIDQHVAAELQDVGIGSCRDAAPCELFEICPPRLWPPDIPESSRQHTVGAIHLPGFVQEHGPRELHLVGVHPGLGGRLERDDHRADVPPFQLAPTTLQLQQVPAAGESTEMAMEDHQQPATSIMLERVQAPPDVWQRKSNRWLSDSSHQLISASR